MPSRRERSAQGAWAITPSDRAENAPCDGAWLHRDGSHSVDEQDRADDKAFINHLFQLVAGTHQILKVLSDNSSVTVKDCRLPASLVWLARGPGGRHVSSNSSTGCNGLVLGRMRTLFLRRRRQLLQFPGVYLTGASLLFGRRRVLQRRQQLLFSPALLPGATALLPVGSTLLLGAALLPTGATALSEPWLARARPGPLGQ